MPSSYAAAIDLSLSSLFTASAEATDSQEHGVAWLWQVTATPENDGEGS